MVLEETDLSSVSATFLKGCLRNFICSIQDMCILQRDIKYDGSTRDKILEETLLPALVPVEFQCSTEIIAPVKISCR
jgi:hypothetical protein